MFGRNKMDKVYVVLAISGCSVREPYVYKVVDSQDKAIACMEELSKKFINAVCRKEIVE